MIALQTLHYGQGRVIRCANDITRKYCRVYRNKLTTAIPENKLSLSNITIANDTSKVVSAVQKLYQLPEDRAVAWDVKWLPSSSNRFSLSAYAGDDFDFGNGPCLVITNIDHSKQKNIASLLQAYFIDPECQKIWFDLQRSYQIMKKLDIVPQGFHGECIYAAHLARKKELPDDIEALARIFLTTNEWENTRKLSPGKLKPVESEDEELGNVKGSEMSERDQKHLIKVSADAKTIFKLGCKLQQILQREKMHGSNTLPWLSTSVYNLRAVYSSFYHPVAQQLQQIEQRGIEIDRLEVENLKQLAINEKQQCHTVFRNWASQHSHDAKFIDLGCADQIRQLIFAPCVNRHDKTKKLSRQKTFVIKNKTKKTRNERRKSISTSNTKEITIEGAGIKPAAYLKNGWPSTALKELRKAAEKNEQLGEQLSSDDSISFLDAVKHLEQAKSIENSVSAINENVISGIVDNRVHLPSSICRSSGSVRHISSDKNWESFFRKTLRAAPGNSLITVEYNDLELRALGQLSGCKHLQNRLNSNTDIHMLAASSLFRPVMAAFNGTGDVSTITESSTSANSTMQEQFPEEYETAKVLDWGAVKGRNIVAIANRTGWEKSYVQKLMKCWDEMHPFVEKWRQELANFGQQNGFVETMMGRRIPVKKKRGTSKKMSETTLVDITAKVISGTAGEVVMASILKLGSNERLHALGWNVVLVDRHTLILEGPIYAQHIAINLIAQDTLQPFAEDLDVELFVDVGFKES